MWIQVYCAPEFHNDFWQKKIFSFFKNNCKFIHHKSHQIGYLPCIVHSEYFSIIFNVKKCALYSIKYGTSKRLASDKHSSLFCLSVAEKEKSFITLTPGRTWGRTRDPEIKKKLKLLFPSNLVRVLDVINSQILNLTLLIV